MKDQQSKRFKRVIENDRMSLTGESSALIIEDLRQVLSEYFVISQEPSLSVSVKNGEYCVSISFKANSLKTFARIT